MRVPDRIRVLRIIARLNVGGPAIHATLLTNRLDPARFESRLVHGPHEPSEGSYLDLHGIRGAAAMELVPELGREVRGPRDLLALRRLVGIMRRERPHVVHTHTAKAGMLGRLAAWWTGVPVTVHTYHGHVLRGYFPPARTRAFTAIERRLATISTRLIAVAPRVRDELLALGVGRPDQYEVIRLGLDLEAFAGVGGATGSVRVALGIPAGAFVIAAVGRLVPIKRHDVLLEAVAQLPAGLDWRLLLAGDGELRAPLEQRAAALGVRGRVAFLGWRADLAEIYADADVAALTSDNEGSPVALIEAMAASRPVVATRVGGVPDVVLHGEHGLLVEPGDVTGMAAALARLARAPDTRARFGDAGRRHVLSLYRAERLVSEVDALYRRLIAGAEGRA
jgi:glycosyltransferase involved in cell wall biosynthesis